MAYKTYHVCQSLPSVHTCSCQKWVGGQQRACGYYSWNNIWTIGSSENKEYSGNNWEVQFEAEESQLSSRQRRLLSLHPLTSHFWSGCMLRCHQILQDRVNWSATCHPSARSVTVDQGMRLTTTQSLSLHNKVSAPNWATAACLLLLIQPSSAVAERAFSILSSLFGDCQDCPLQDYVEASLMLQYDR